MVVSCVCVMREKAYSALPITNGARDMDSTPPAITNSSSQVLIPRLALPTASIPDPHSRLIVAAGTSGGSPASRADMRPTLRLSSPASAESHRRGDTVSTFMLTAEQTEGRYSIVQDHRRRERARCDDLRTGRIRAWLLSETGAYGGGAPEFIPGSQIWPFRFLQRV